MKRIVFTLLMIVAVIQTIFSGGTRETQKVEAALNQPDVMDERSISEILYSLSNIYALLDRYYLYEIDNEEMAENLISAMIASLGDKYSYYVKAEDMSEYEEQYTGEYVGIGTYVAKMNPIYAEYDDPLSWMLQIVSEPLTLTVFRDGNEFEVTLIPEHVITPNLSYSILYDDVGYLHIYTFNESSAKSVEDALNSMIKDGIASLIIDLRNNGGGTVDTSEIISDMFLSDGVIINVHFKDGSGIEDTTYYADRNTMIDDEVPIVILVNGGTASASEIMTAALKDNGRATVIGSQTFGKGIIQSVIPYNGGFICFTDANYFTPGGDNIHEIGITPDIIINEKEYSEEELKSYENFLSGDSIETFIESNPDYSIENIERFADENSNSGVPRDLLILLIRNEYYYRMDYDERPAVLVDYDDVLIEALRFLGKEI